MRKLFLGITIVFLLFIILIIYSADTGRNNIFFDFVNWLPFGDKIGHFFLFGIFTLSLNVALKFKRVKLWQKLPLGTVLISIVVILEELSQAFFPNRTLDITYLIADALGILFFTYISYLLYESKTFGLPKLNYS